VGYDTSIAVDALGDAHISYQDGTAFHLLYAHKKFGVWELLDVDDSFNNVGLYTSITLGPLAAPHISYQDGTAADLMYATGPMEVTAVGDPPHPRAGIELAISPNPCAVGSRIQFALAEPKRFRALEVYDVAGRLERRLAVDGAAIVAWDGTNSAGIAVSPGIHLVRPVRTDGGAGAASRIVLVH
jgi:hypothetical protein